MPAPASGTQTRVASANVLYSLAPEDARTALDAILALEPDLVGLQEWYPTRFRLLRETGHLGFVPQVAGRLQRSADRGTPDYLWNTPLLGGCAVGARADRFALVHCRTRFLSAPGLSDRKEQGRSLEPGRAATVAVYRDLQADRTVCLVDYHLVSGVQAGGRYRTDRPVLTARHRREAAMLGRIVREQLAEGHVVLAAGDSNFHGLRIEGLTSAWEGREQQPGTLGLHRQVDDVHGPGPAEAVTVVTTASDHRAIVVRRTHRADS
ncbi:MAG: hypothetical protein JWQ93_23 [Marmoricola sp.]|nr:hypothetical protein [Marmoricola sp.]